MANDPKMAPAMPGKTPMKGRSNPVANQMSRRDSLASINEFGSVLTGEQQAKARANMQNKKKPGPLHMLFNALAGGQD